MTDVAQAPDRPAIEHTAFYQDPQAALDWLEKAFGFEVTFLLTDKDGNIAHATMGFRGSTIGVAGEWEGIGKPWAPAQLLSPRTIGNVGTQFMWVELEAGIEEHCERARAAGAKILQEPEDQFYGARTYRALDLDGHVWNFRQQVRHVSDQEMEARTGLKSQPLAKA